MYRFRFIFSIIVFGLFCPIVSAWTEGSFMYILADAKHLMPDKLQWGLGRFESSLVTGMKNCSVKYTSQEELVNAILSESSNGINCFKSNGSYKSGVRKMGRIARMIAQLNHPLEQTKHLKHETWRTDYDIYLEKHRQYFRIRWTGVNNRPQSSDELSSMLSISSHRTRKIASILLKTFETNKIPIGNYDARSIPFGVGSMSYSRSVSNTAMSWLYMWDQAGGVKNVSSFLKVPQQLPNLRSL